MIHRYDNTTQTRWQRGEFKVQLDLPGNSRPMGFSGPSGAILLWNRTGAAAISSS